MNDLEKNNGFKKSWCGLMVILFVLLLLIFSAGCGHNMDDMNGSDMSTSPGQNNGGMNMDH